MKPDLAATHEPIVVRLGPHGTSLPGQMLAYPAIADAVIARVVEPAGTYWTVLFAQCVSD